MKKLCRTEYNKTNDSHNNIHYYVDTVDIPAAHTCHAIGVNKKNKDSPRITYKEIRIFCETDFVRQLSLATIEIPCIEKRSLCFILCGGKYLILISRGSQRLSGQ